MTTPKNADGNSAGDGTLLSTSTNLTFTKEEPELSSISFQESLRFFQEQLINNSTSQSPYINPLKIRLHHLGKNPDPRNMLATSLIPSAEENANILTSSKISPIPTVETILESVRILRAIQKSQAQRGSIWTLECEDDDILDRGLNHVDSILALEEEDLQVTLHNDLTKCSIAQNEQTVYPDVLAESEVSRTSEDSNSNPFWPNTVVKLSHESDPKNSIQNLGDTRHLLLQNLDRFSNPLPSPDPSNDRIISENIENIHHDLGNKGMEEFETGNFKEERFLEIECQNRSISCELQKRNCVINESDIEREIPDTITEVRASDRKNSIRENGGSEMSHQDLMPIESLDDTRETLLNVPGSHVSVFKEYESRLLCLNLDCENTLNFPSDDGNVELSHFVRFNECLLDDMTEDYLSCSSMSLLDERNSAKTDNGNRSSSALDSGIGMGKSMSVSSSSPSVSGHREELEIPSWSESSHYDSAEGSPYASFSDVAIATSLPRHHVEPNLDPMNQKIDDPNSLNDNENEETLSHSTFVHQHPNYIEETSSVEADVDLGECSSNLGNADNSGIHDLSAKDNFHYLIYHQPDNFEISKLTEVIQSDRLLESVEDCAKQMLYSSNELNDEIICVPSTVSDSVGTQNGKSKEPEANQNKKNGGDINENSDSKRVNEMVLNDHSKKMENWLSVSECFELNSKNANIVKKTDSDNINVKGIEEDKEQLQNIDWFPSQINNAFQVSDDPIIPSAVEKSTEPMNDLLNSEKCKNNTLPEDHEKIVVSRQNSKKIQSCVSIAEVTLNVPHFSIMDDQNITLQSEDLRPKKTSSSWDPVPLLNHLYQMELLPMQQSSGEEHSGYLDILPLGTFVNRGGSYFIKLVQSVLLFYETDDINEPILKIPLQYGRIEVFENNIMILDNRRGRNIHMKFQSCSEMELWRATFELHCFLQRPSKCVEPIHFPLKCHKNVIIIDLGSCSTRAGILMDQPTLPHIFFPTVCATNYAMHTQIYGMEALLPEVRQSTILSFPVRTSAKVTKFTMDIDALKGLFQKIFGDLRVDPKEYTIQVCLPRVLCTNTQAALLKLLLEELEVKSVSLTRQALLTLYAYDSSTGIVVDIGDRMDILTVVDGFIIERGVSRLPYGGQRVIHHMKHALAQKHISLSNEVESFVVQYIMENLCYVAEDYQKELKYLATTPEGVKKSLPLFPFFQGDDILLNVTLDGGRFQTPEGFFDPDLWGVDFPGLHKLVYQAIQCVGVDVRRCIAESIFVSGGVTLMPGLVERLEAEVSKLTLPRIKPQIHASPYRYHMAYLGACQLASSEGFSQVCVTAEEWNREGSACLSKWHL